MTYKYEITKDSKFGYSICSTEKLDGEEFLEIVIKAYEETKEFEAEALKDFIVKKDKRFYEVLPSETNFHRMNWTAKVILIDDHDIITFANVETTYTTVRGFR